MASIMTPRRSTPTGEGGLPPERHASPGDAPGMTTATCAPVDSGQRLALLDALRGFALAGVLLANLVAFCLVFFLPDAGMAALPTAGLDRLLHPALIALVGGKFISLFSLLFGVGFALQMQRAAGAGASGDGAIVDGASDDRAIVDRVAMQRYLRRLLALLAIGLLHAYLLWWGDILRYYAVLGLLLLPAYRLPLRGLVGLGAVLVVAHPLLAEVFADAALPLATEAQVNAIALGAFASGDWSTMLRGNRILIDWWLPARWGLALLVAGCMLIGAALGRSGVLHDPAAHARFWKRWLVALPVGLALVLGLTLSSYGRLPWPAGWQDAAAAQLLLRVLGHVAVMVLALGYMAGFVQLFQLPRWRCALLLLAPVGRMALSNYLAQSLIGVGLFYGVGLGLGPRYGLPGVVVVWAVVFALQVGVSQWWLARLRFGPAEWLWRSATYGRLQPMRR